MLLNKKSLLIPALLPLLGVPALAQSLDDIKAAYSVCERHHQTFTANGRIGMTQAYVPGWEQCALVKDALHKRQSTMPRATSSVGSVATRADIQKEMVDKIVKELGK